jgi:hypothetical protein
VGAQRKNEWFRMWRENFRRQIDDARVQLRTSTGDVSITFYFIHHFNICNGVYWRAALYVNLR